MKSLSKKHLQTLLLLCLVPVIVTFFEKIIFGSLYAPLALPNFTAVTLIGLSSCVLLVSFASWVKNSYGFTIDQKSGKVISILLLVLLGVSFLFLYSLKIKNLANEFAVVHLMNFYILIFREEFFSRGLIQTEAQNILKGKFLHISLPVWFSTLIFSLWHLVNLPYFPVQTVFIQMLVAIPTGLLVGVIKEKTGNTFVTYLIHLIGDLLFLSCYLLLAGTPFLPLF